MVDLSFDLFFVFYLWLGLFIKWIILCELKGLFLVFECVYVGIVVFCCYCWGVDVKIIGFFSCVMLFSKMVFYCVISDVISDWDINVVLKVFFVLVFDV